MRMTYRYTISIYISIFTVIIPLVTYFVYSGQSDIFKLLALIVISICSITLFFLFSHKEKFQDLRKVEYSTSKLFWLSVIAFLPLLGFVFNSIQDFSFLEMVVFSEKYRQGGFSGSGIYIVWVTQILPIIVLTIMLSNGFSGGLIFPILVIVLASFVLGLRVYLWGIFFGGFVIMMNNVSVRKLLFFVVTICLFFGYKIYLSQESNFDPVDFFFKQFTRPDLHAIVKADVFQDNIVDVFEFAPFFRLALGHNIEAFKEFYIYTIPDIGVLMPYVSLLSGVALPGYVLFYNIAFIGAIIINTFFIVFIYFCLIQSIKQKKIFLKIFYTYILQVVSSAFLEDINILYKLEVEIIYPTIAYLLIFLILKNSRRQI